MKVDGGVVIVGAGQGGLSVSYFLTRSNVDHVVLDRFGPGAAWRKHRWDSFALVTPNWTIKLPGAEYSEDDPDGFMLRDDFARYMSDWADSFNAPVQGGINVTRISRNARNSSRFELETSIGPMQADIVVVATATYQHPRIPPVSASLPRHIRQLHAADYKNPYQALDGPVMVVGSGQTGFQIVEDFLRAGVEVYFCTGRTGRLPRRYRGRDCLEWQAEMGTLDRTPDMLDGPADRFLGDPHVTGRDGGSTVSYFKVYKRAVRLLGRLTRVKGDVMEFDNSLAENIAYADRFSSELMDSMDAHIARTCQDTSPAAAGEHADGHWDASVPIPETRQISLSETGIRTVIWATGFTYDFSWVEFPVTDSMGYPETENGASSVPGLYFCGLNWMTRRKSGILYGVAEDGQAVAKQIIALTDARTAGAKVGVR